MSIRIAPQPRTEIELTDTESRLCTLLDECTAHLKKEHGIITACRINGGWVRDKLLGSQSNDIDVCLTDMMGVPFAEHFVSFLAEKKLLNMDEIKIAKIESNPDQSKHLETARTTVFGIDLDFVNLRSEEYAENSRIPTEIKFGTPLQDAMRRDITINSLFYNVHTRSVEDHIEKGLDDLRSGIIRTPLTPLETFKDDPLRVIRCVRFASRFGFELDPELRDAAQHPAIQEALSLKISRERVGEEMDKMMKGPDPLRAISLIDELSLYPSIFYIPPQIMDIRSTSPQPFQHSVIAARILHSLLSGNATHIPLVHPTILSQARNDPGLRARLFFATGVYPYTGITYTTKKRKISLVEAAICEGLKLGSKNHYSDGIPALFAAAERLKNLDLSDDKLKVPSERVAIGLLLRDKSVHYPITGSHWTGSLLFSLVCELVPLENVIDISDCVERYNGFTRRVEELGLDEIVDAKPILNGHEVTQTFDAKPGPWTQSVLNKVVEWQLEYPSGTKDDCVAWLNAEKEAGRINMDDLTAAHSGSKRIQASDKSAKAKKMKR
ncbi:hypothetical protein BJ138DRAFT_1170563 [Hygrophoropsis aurantiaca]|uniref:Uncharacterized protein n=1 Tax=Hygrophoropsis aurantiaca TaxID=72124 RepID=A0ACB8ANE2_9AGAM|nr:hypothetical protein BJ138DRAFT_1170563 [Hygrophoropsis aurantiaca]